MIEEINKKYHWADAMFAEECRKRIGIKPSEDDKLVLDAAVKFQAYIRTFKRLDQSVDWHQDMVSTMVRNKVDTLVRRINKQYGSNKGYLDRMRERSRSRSEKNRRDRQAKKVEPGESRVVWKENKER